MHASYLLISLVLLTLKPSQLNLETYNMVLMLEFVNEKLLHDHIEYYIHVLPCDPACQKKSIWGFSWIFYFGGFGGENSQGKSITHQLIV